MITLSNKHLAVKINEWGAEVSSVTDKKTGYEFIWQADENYWGRHAPVLFPIVGRLKKNQYQCKKQTYEMTQHGFARDSLLKVEENTENTATFSLTDHEETHKKYPFNFKMIIKYKIICINELHNNQHSTSHKQPMKQARKILIKSISVLS